MQTAALHSWVAYPKELSCPGASLFFDDFMLLTEPGIPQVGYGPAGRWHALATPVLPDQVS